MLDPLWPFRTMLWQKCFKIFVLIYNFQWNSLLIVSLYIILDNLLINNNKHTKKLNGKKTSDLYMFNFFRINCTKVFTMYDYFVLKCILRKHYESETDQINFKLLVHEIFFHLSLESFNCYYLDVWCIGERLLFISFC